MIKGAQSFGRGKVRSARPALDVRVLLWNSNSIARSYDLAGRPRRALGRWPSRVCGRASIPLGRGSVMTSCIVGPAVPLPRSFEVRTSPSISACTEVPVLRATKTRGLRSWGLTTTCCARNCTPPVRSTRRSSTGDQGTGGRALRRDLRPGGVRVHEPVTCRDLTTCAVGQGRTVAQDATGGIVTTPCLGWRAVLARARDSDAFSSPRVSPRSPRGCQQ